jgi:transcriptional regulator GlxA family with amidase domain
MARKPTSAGIAPRRPKVVAIVAYDGVVLADLAGPAEVFRRVVDSEGRPLYRVVVCGERARVRSNLGALTMSGGLGVLARADTVIVPGLEDLDAVPSPRLVSALRRAIGRGGCVASICTGAFVLAATGCLAGRRVTTHWLACDALRARYPALEVDSSVLYVDNGQLLTSAGAAAGLDLCIHLVRRDYGADVAAAVARAIVMPLERAGGQAQFIEHAAPAADGTAMSDVLVWLSQNLDKKLSLATIARRAGTSPRTLSRRFPEQVGMTPAQWIVAARIREAQRLLEASELAIESIAERVGFGSGAVLREHFGKIVGTSPNAYRQSFRARPQGRGARPFARGPGSNGERAGRAGRSSRASRSSSGSTPGRQPSGSRVRMVDASWSGTATKQLRHA